MVSWKLATKMSLASAFLVALLLAITLSACSGSAGNESAGEHGGTGGESGSESSNERGASEGVDSSSAEKGEAAMSSPIVPLDQPWNGALGGLAVSARYDAATQTVHSTVQNTTQQKLCYVQAEPHLKSGGRTVGELGPDKLGDLNPAQEATTSLPVVSEPNLAGVSYDGYVIHMEVFDCAGPGPVPHTVVQGAEGSGEEGSANMLAPNETFDAVRGGARLVLNYDATSNSFKGVVENTTNSTLTRVRIEVHLSNGTELGPTTPTDLAPGQGAIVNLPAAGASVTGWVAHAEVGGGNQESGSGGEHGSGSGGEHGSGSGEHGGSGERRGGG